MIIYHVPPIEGTRNQALKHRPGTTSSWESFVEAWDDYVALGRGLRFDSKDGWDENSSVLKKKYNENHWNLNIDQSPLKRNMNIIFQNIFLGVVGHFSVLGVYITLTSKTAALTLEDHDWWLATHRPVLSGWMVELKNFSMDGKPYQNLNQNGSPVWNGSWEKSLVLAMFQGLPKLRVLMCGLWDADASSLQSSNDRAYLWPDVSGLWLHSFYHFNPGSCHAWCCKMKG